MKLASGGIAVPAHPFIGIDLRDDPKIVPKGILLTAQNLVPYQRGVLTKRKGTSKLNSSAWTDVLRVPLGIRFTPTGGSAKTLVYVNKAAGDSIGSVDDTTGALTALTGLPALTGEKRGSVQVFGETSAAYFANDTNGIVKTTNGVAGAALTGTEIPAACFMAKTPYYDRMVAFHGKRVLYSRTNLDNNWSDPDTGNPQYVLVNHPEDISAVFTPGPYKSDTGYVAKLLICTPTSTWVKHLDFGTGQLIQIHDTAGVANLNTVVSTDRGAIGMGTQTVWLFPLDGLPEDVGSAIESVIRAIPAASRNRCSATFWQGFYILSVVRPGQTDPDVEYWADMRGKLKIGQWGEYPVQWYGPMIRGTVRLESYVVRSQQPDEYALFGFSALDGTCYTLEDSTTYQDAGADMTSILGTRDLAAESPNEKSFPGYILGVYVADDDQVTVGWIVDEYSSSGSKVLSVSATGSRFDTAVWDTAVWGGAGYQVQSDYWATDVPSGRKIRFTVTHTSNLPISIKELYAIVNLFGRV